MGEGGRMSTRKVGDRAVIPVFPLGTVLVPGLVLPLHIFEPRYRQLVQDLLALPEDDRGFGVVAIREGREVGDDGVTALYDIGTLAVLRDVEPYTDGRYDLVSNGDARFRLHALVDAGTPYLSAEVEWLAEDDGGSPGETDVLGSAVTRRFDVYRGLLAEVGAVEAAQMANLPDDPAVLSYLVAVAMVLDLHDRQRLLECGTTADRLRAEITLLNRESTLVKELPSLPAVDLARTPSGMN
jgi:Lon protease-like protein